MLNLHEIHTYYGESYILQGVSLEVKQGSIVALLGRNGMGKTTTINSIVGFTPVRRGEIYFKGKSIVSTPPYEIARMGIGLIPQGRRIFRSLSVLENLIMSARERGSRDAWSLDRVYSLFPILKQRARYSGILLSGGEQQMLAIGRALMTNPDLILMDELSEGLAPIVVREIKKVIVQLKESGFSIFLVEQNYGIVSSLSDYVYVLSKGMIVYHSTTRALDENEEVKTIHLGAVGKKAT